MNNRDCRKFREGTCRGEDEKCYHTCAIMADSRYIAPGMSEADYNFEDFDES